MPNFIDCWELVYGKRLKHRDGSDVLTSHDKQSLVSRIAEHVRAGERALDAAKLAVASHLQEVEGQLKSIAEQSAPRAAAPAAGKPPAFKGKLFQGRGASPEDIYGPEAVKGGYAVPILGPGDYFAHTEEHAKDYGDTVSAHDVELHKPLVIDSDKSWRELLSKANANVLDSRGRERFEHPERIKAATERVKAYLLKQGHDGVIVKLPRGDMNEKGEIIKSLRESFGHSQVIRYAKPAAPAPEPAAAPKAAPAPTAERAKVIADAEKALADMATEEEAMRQAASKAEEAGNMAEGRRIRDDLGSAARKTREHDLLASIASARGSEGIDRMHRETAQFRGRPEPARNVTITSKMIKGQKEYLLHELDDAIKEAGEEGSGKITIDVPGDGSWTIQNNKTSLKRFREIVQKQFPSAVKTTDAPTKTSQKGRTAPAVTEPDAKDLPKLIAPFLSDDETRQVLQYAYADGTQIVATNGRMLMRIVSDKAPGAPDAPVRTDAEGKLAPEENNSRYPNYEQVLDRKAELLYGGADTAQLFQLARMGEVFQKLGTSDHVYGLKIVVNKDRTIGATVDHSGDHYEHNIQPDAYYVGKYSPNYLLDLVATARRLGNEKIDLYRGEGQHSPLMIYGKNFEAAVMGMKDEATEPQPDPASKFTGVAGRAEHARPGPGLPPMEHPDAHRESGTIETATGKMSVELENGIVTFQKLETASQGTYAGKWAEVGTVPLADLGDGDTLNSIRGKTIAAIGAKTGETTQANANARTRKLMDELKKLEQQREAILKEGAKRRGTPPPANPGPYAMGIKPPLPPGAAAVAAGWQRLAKSIQGALAPASMGSAAMRTGGNLRERNAAMHREWIQAREKLKEAKEMFDKQSNAANLDFIDRVERGVAQPTPELDIIARELRKALRDRVRQVRALGTGRLARLIQNYFPHIWEDPAKASAFYQAAFGKRPFEGSKAFLRKRSLPTTADGIRAGLRPVSYNPIDLLMLKLHEMDRYVMAHKVLNEMKENGLAKFVNFGGKAPDGWLKIDDKIAQVIQMQPTTLASGAPGAAEAVLRGHYYAPEGAARIINQFLSAGLRGKPMFDMVRAAGNALNQFQLGFSLYHGTFTAIDANASKFALGLKQLVESGGNPVKIGQGLASIAKSTVGSVVGYAPLEALWEGSKVLKEYYQPGAVGGEMADIVAGLIAGGGRVEMDTFYKNSSIANFRKALRNAPTEGFGKVIWHAPWAALDAASKPIMEFWVPRLKLGIFADLARHELANLPAGTTHEELRARMGKLWDAVDQRMGQMVYDNLFWDKTLKDLSMVSVRSVGWNLGTIQALGGGIVDTTTIRSRMSRGDRAITDKMYYLIAMPFMVGMLGAMIQYLFTGIGPKEVIDYFLPKNGQKRADGSDERVILPSYMKDILPLVKAFKEGVWTGLGRTGHMVLNKANPLLTVVADMLQNKDFFGRPIAKPEDPLVKQVDAYRDFLISQFKSLSLRAMERNQSTSGKVASLFGFQPAPAELNPSADRSVQASAHKFVAQSGAPSSGEHSMGPYHDLHAALERNNEGLAVEEIKKLLADKRTAKNIVQTMAQATHRPFTGSLAMERQWIATLNPEQLTQYQTARREQVEVYRRFVKAWALANKKP